MRREGGRVGWMEGMEEGRIAGRRGKGDDWMEDDGWNSKEVEWRNEWVERYMGHG
jgi:hypothetical protein